MKLRCILIIGTEKTLETYETSVISSRKLVRNECVVHEMAQAAFVLEIM